MIPADYEQWRAREVARLLALVEAERRYYQDILASVPAGLAVVGGDLSLLSANRAFRALFTLRDTPLNRVRLGDLFRGEEVRQAIRAAAQGAAPGARLVAVSAAAKRLRVWVQPLRGWSDEAEVLLLVQEAAEGEPGPRLVESGAPVTDWLETLGAVVWEREAASLGVTAVFGAAAAVLGYEASEWLSAPDLHLQRVHPEDRARLEEIYRSAAAGEEPQPCDYRAVRADGRTVWLRDIVAAAGRDDGGAVKLRGLTIDITDLKEVEEERAQSEKMAALGRLAAKVSHEAGNLLLAISGSGEQLLRLLPPDHPARREADEIVSAIQRFTRIQRELQSVGRPPSLRPRVFEVNALVQGLAQQWRRQVGEGVELALSLGEEVGRVHADAEALSGILTALIEQAKAGMPEGGRIEVATGRIERKTEGAFASITITDSGPDLDEETRSRLFEPFFSSGRFPQGLAGAYSVVRASGGEISVRRAPRGGASFTILLPQVDVSAVVNSGPPAPPPRRGGETVLVVEDEPGIRALMRKILQKQGYEVLEARNGEEALALAEQRRAPIDLLLADVEMPEMSGYELAARLKGLRPEMKILFVSGLPAEELERFGQPPAHSSFLRKPFSLAALLDKTRSVLDGTDQPES